MRNLAGQQAGIQAAYYGFIDRYHAIPGDMESNAAADALGVSATAGGNGNGRLGGPALTTGTFTLTPADNTWVEPNALWVHLSDSGFIGGTYVSANTNAPEAENGPQNVFNGNLVLARSKAYLMPTGVSEPVRLLLHMGRQIPVNIARELDVKLDDGQPQTGTLRGTPNGAEAYNGNDACIADSSSTTDNSKVWDIASNSQDCNPTYLF